MATALGGICGRTEAVQEAVLEEIKKQEAILNKTEKVEKRDCSSIMMQDLKTIKELSFRPECSSDGQCVGTLKHLKEGDFFGLSSF